MSAQHHSAEPLVDQDEMEATRAPLTEHLRELRQRFIVCLIGLAIGFGLSWTWVEDLFGLLLIPLQSAVGDPSLAKIHHKDLTEPFFVLLKTALLCATVLNVPVMLHQMWGFIAPGLYPEERRVALPFVVAGTLLFLLGAGFGFGVILPLGYGALIDFGGRTATPDLMMQEYLGLTMKLILAFGAVFQMPLLASVLARAGVLHPLWRKMLAGWRFALVGCFIIGAMLTPPDVISQMLLAGPMMCLYMISVGCAYLLRPRDLPDPEAEALAAGKAQGADRGARQEAPRETRKERRQRKEAEMTPGQWALARIRRHILAMLVGLAVGFGVAWTWVEEIFAVLIEPLRRASTDPALAQVHFRDLTEPFFVLLKTAIATGLVLAFPVVIYNLWQLLGLAARALHRHHPHLDPTRLLRWSGGVVAAATALFYLSIALGLAVVLPYGYQAMLFVGWDDLAPKLMMEEHLKLSIKLVFLLGIAFEIPLVSLLLVTFTRVDARRLLAGWRVALLVFLTLGMMFWDDWIEILLWEGASMGVYLASASLLWVLGRRGPRDEAATPAPTPQASESSEGGPPAWYAPHLRELTRRTLASVLAIAVGMAVAWVWADVLLDVMLEPLRLATKDPSLAEVHFRKMTEPVMVRLFISFMAGLALSVPVLLYQAWQFIGPGLLRTERRAALPGVVAGTAFFAVGAVFCYKIILPFGYEALLGFAGDLSEPDLMIQEYLELTAKLLLAFGVIFQMPLVASVLARLGILSHTTMLRYWRFALVGCFVVGALLTPPDAVSQALLAAPMMLLYMISVGCAWLFAPRAAVAEAD